MRTARGLTIGLLALGLAGAASADAELAETPRAAAAEQPKAAAGEPSVTRALITNAIEDREPVDDVSEFHNDQPIIYFFTELLNLEGVTVTHRWELDGKPMAEVPLRVGSPRWRVWSSKNLEPEWTGEWKVSVVGSGGEVLEEARFSYLPVAEAGAPATPAAPQPN